MSVVSLNSFIKHEYIYHSNDEVNLTNYRPESIDLLIAEIIAPIRKTLGEIPSTKLPDKKVHVDSIKKYQKRLKDVLVIDHVEQIERAISDKGIIGENDADAVDNRKRKVEWANCLYVTEHLGERLGKMLKTNGSLGDVFTIKVDKQNCAYPLVLHMLKSIKVQLVPI